MQKSDSIKNLAKALAAFQAEVKNPANTADNPFFKSKYAPLPDILGLVRPLLSKHGLSLLQAPSGDGEKVIITTLLMHESGEWIETCPLILKADKATAQGAGSAITYGRRYALSAVLGISSEDDDDGNEASKPGNNKQTKTNTQPSKPEKGKDKSAEVMTTKGWEDFWRNIGNMGCSDEEVYSAAGVSKEELQKWNRVQVIELFKKLKEGVTKSA